MNFRSQMSISDYHKWSMRHFSVVGLADRTIYIAVQKKSINGYFPV